MVNSPKNHRQGQRQDLDLTSFSAADGEPVAWRISDAPVPYPEAVAEMEARVAAIAAGEAPELVWLLEHPPLYTSGTSGKESDLLDARFPTFATGRGGQLTYHGPGQRVAYVMLDLKRRRPDVRAYVASLEELILRTLAADVEGSERPQNQLLQARDIGPDIGPAALQVEHDIGHALAWPMVGELAATPGGKGRESGIEQVGGLARGA